MAQIRNLKDNGGNVFYPLTHERAVKDSNGVSLESKLAGLESKSYVEAWDGASTPVVENIPEGVVVTYNTTTYTGALQASANTIGKTYLVKNGNNYDRYITSQSGSTYSWVPNGSTEMDLSGYATDAELKKLGQEIESSIMLNSWCTIPESGVAYVQQTNVFFQQDTTREKPTRISAIKFLGIANTEVQFWKVTAPNVPNAGTDGSKQAITEPISVTEDGEQFVLVDVELGANDYIGFNGRISYYSEQTGGGYTAIQSDGSYGAMQTGGKLGFELLSSPELLITKLSQEVEDTSSSLAELTGKVQDDDVSSMQKYVNNLLSIQDLEAMNFQNYESYVGTSSAVFANLQRYSGNNITDIFYKTRGGTTKFYLVTLSGKTVQSSIEIASNTIGQKENAFIAQYHFQTPVTISDNQLIAISGNVYYGNNSIDDKSYAAINVGNDIYRQAGSEIAYVAIDNNLVSKSILKDGAESFLTPSDFIRNIGHIFEDGHETHYTGYRNTGYIDVSSIYRVVASFQTQGIGTTYGPAIILFDSHLKVVTTYNADSYQRNCLFDIFIPANVKYMLINSYYELNGADYTTYWCVAYKRVLKSRQANVLYRRSFNNTVVFPEFLNASPSNFTENGLVVNSETPIQLYKYFSLQTRTLRVLFNTIGGTIFKVSSDDGLSSVTINTSTSTMTMQATTPVSVDINWSSSNTYLLEITREYAKNIARLTCLNTSEVFTLEHTENGTGGAGQGAVGTSETAGAWHDYYQFSVTAGQAYIKEMQVVPLYGKVKTLLYGDSITELLYYPQADYPKSWVQLFIDACANRVMVSPRGGKTITQVNERIVNELPYINAEYVMVTIGTNGGNTVENLSQLVEYIISQGAVPVLNHIPCNESGTQVSVNATIDQVRAKYGIHGVDFDLATSVGLDGLSVDTSKMWWEDYSEPTGSIYHHPNVNGSRAMFEQIKLDMPELFI